MAKKATTKKVDSAKVEMEMVYRVASEDATEIETISKADAITDLGDDWDATVLEQFFKSGEVLPSESYMYSANKEILQGFLPIPESVDDDIPMDDPADGNELQVDTSDEFSQETPDAPFSVGDRVVHTENAERFGEVVMNGDVLSVKFEVNGRDKVGKLHADKWRKLSDEEITDLDNKSKETETPTTKDKKGKKDKESSALTKTDGVINGVAEVPMTKEEYETLRDAETRLTANLEAINKIPVFIGQDLSLINESRLYRGEYKTFEQYVNAKFGVSRDYAYELMSASATCAVIGEQGQKLAVKTLLLLGRSAGNLVDNLEVIGSDSEKEAIAKDVLRASSELLFEVAPKDENGNPLVTQKLAQRFTDATNDILSQEVFEIDGKQVPFSEVAKSGMTSAVVTSQLLGHVTESLKRETEVLRSRIQENHDRQNTGVTHKDNPSKVVELWKGQVPVIVVTVNGKDALIESIGNGVFQTNDKNKTRWRIDADSGSLVPFETAGKKIEPKKK